MAFPSAFERPITRFSSRWKIVEREHRGDGHEQPDRGGDQRLRDARHHE